MSVPARTRFVLITWCGCVTGLATEMHDDNFKNITNIDISETVIQNMQTKTVGIHGIECACAALLSLLSQPLSTPCMLSVCWNGVYLCTFSCISLSTPCMLSVHALSEYY